MFDIHSHLLFGVDDGPETMEGTMRMIEHLMRIVRNTMYQLRK